MTKPFRILRAPGLGAAMLVAVPAGAQSSTIVLDSQVEITDSCVVSATPMVFNIANLGAPAAVDATAVIAINCAGPTFYVVEMDRGRQPNGAQRRMANGQGNFLAYNIYRNPARTTNWGTGLFGGQVGLTFGGTTNLTAYGRIPSVSSATPRGVYEDTITVTLNF